MNILNDCLIYPSRNLGYHKLLGFGRKHLAHSCQADFMSLYRGVHLWMAIRYLEQKIERKYAAHQVAQKTLLNLLFYPLTVVWIRYLFSDRSLLCTVKAIYQEYGIMGFFVGVQYSLLQRIFQYFYSAFPNSPAISWMQRQLLRVYNIFKQFPEKQVILGLSLSWESERFRYMLASTLFEKLLYRNLNDYNLFISY